jgi:hypothetical protein
LKPALREICDAGMGYSHAQKSHAAATVAARIGSLMSNQR